MASQAYAQKSPCQQWIGCLTYKSMATSSPSRADLAALVRNARMRNRQLGITGMLLFEDGCFLQTLEGPPAHVDLVWNAIKRDPRHRDIQIMSEHVSNARLFSQWDLMLYDRHCNTGAGACSAPPPAVARYIRKLVRLAIEGDDIGIDALIITLGEQGWKADAIIALLIEPAARALGDAWLADECCEIDLTIGLSMLQLAGHSVRLGQTAASGKGSRYSILLATAPGEPHRFATALLADQFSDAGWQVDLAFPDSKEALANQVEAQRPDALDISLSDAVPRRHAMIKLGNVVESSRMAAPASSTVISVGGRLFAEAALTAMMVGADHARRSVIGATVNIAELVKQKRLRSRDSYVRFNPPRIIDRRAGNLPTRRGWRQ
jgi:blue light- and temperature-responsive anti-repressor